MNGFLVLDAINFFETRQLAYGQASALNQVLKNLGFCWLGWVKLPQNLLHIWKNGWFGNERRGQQTTMKAIL
mgnify:CR=1 FL=1